ncbi:site-specific integrase, partial [Frankia sp. CpI1-P]
MTGEIARSTDADNIDIDIDIDAADIDVADAARPLPVPGGSAAGGAAPLALPAELAARVGDYARASRSASTWRAYDSDLRQFRAWCARQPAAPSALPATPATVAGYLATLADAGYRPSTIRRRLAAISVAHQLAHHPNPAA